MEGPAEKKGKGQSKFGRRNWKHRYFSLDDQYFTYWNRPGGKKRGFCPSNKISSPCMDNPSFPHDTPYYYLSFMMDGRPLILRFRDQDERDQWFEVLQTVGEGKSVLESPCIAKHVIPDPLEILEKKEKRGSILNTFSRMSQRVRTGSSLAK